MFSEWVLGLWSAAGMAWWLLAWWLVSREAASGPQTDASEATPEFLSIFKPLAMLGAKGLTGEAAGLESFLAQLDAASELLLGIHEIDREVMRPFVERMRSRYPQAQLKVIFRDEPDAVPNPKVAWQMLLAPHARGELWLWSDADILVPPDFLTSLRAEFAAGGAGMLTFPYVVREMGSRAALLDALFVNVEFYPGVLLLRQAGPVDFGLGAGMLFRRSDFLQKVTWSEVGNALADDFVLGQKLGPVRLSRTTLVTVADVSTWRGALLHNLRWSKTVWWNRPGGAAGRIVILPVLGWLVYLLFHLSQPMAWMGLVMMIQVDVFFSAMICRTLGCRWGIRDWPGTEAWSLGRVLIWLACWFPWPVEWRGRRWWGPRWDKQGK